MIDEKSSFRVIINSQNLAKVNMCKDEALIKNFNESSSPILRIYHWSKSITIGISQDIKDYSYLNDFSEDIAKRVTGGGVLFHGHDLSYSLVLPSSYFKDYKIKESYEKICYFLINFYKKLGLDANYAKDIEDVNLSKNEFCQVGFEAYDILIDKDKIGGNAQRRTKRLVFQHGSIPLYSVNDKKVLDNRIGLTLEDLGIDLTYDEATKLLIESFQETFNVDLINSELNDKEKEEEKKLLKEKYDFVY
ncbi:lipoate--protein ligase family protein [Arcobacter roscoffensis]|uniref:Lipoate--protein ligase family protein n=1 Tax=Arcobacter roscoffensis TaxID=2961520 RepID=A0ABY5E143_9BACT|nr:lipoate--protein ligase family protein [Arcobacter roscoffensis]UTJ05929.1 lipoate--protein ligase family protein [Arcobacter roscoffensis]